MLPEWLDDPQPASASVNVSNILETTRGVFIGYLSVALGYAHGFEECYAEGLGKPSLRMASKCAPRAMKATE